MGHIPNVHCIPELLEPLTFIGITMLVYVITKLNFSAIQPIQRCTKFT